VQKVGTRRPQRDLHNQFCGIIYENEPSCYKWIMGCVLAFLLACGRRESVFWGRPTLSHRSVNRFNQREIARALKAARLAGERPERVEIDPATGKIAVIIAKTDDGEPAKNELDNWIEKHAHQTSRD
jgi:hypothetical protein